MRDPVGSMAGNRRLLQPLTATEVAAKTNITDRSNPSGMRLVTFIVGEALLIRPAKQGIRFGQSLSTEPYHALGGDDAKRQRKWLRKSNRWRRSLRLKPIMTEQDAHAPGGRGSARARFPSAGRARLRPSQISKHREGEAPAERDQVLPGLRFGGSLTLPYDAGSAGASPCLYPQVFAPLRTCTQ